jgi:hypothetical protein
MLNCLLYLHSIFPPVLPISKKIQTSQLENNAAIPYNDAQPLEPTASMTTVEESTTPKPGGQGNYKSILMHLT